MPLKNSGLTQIDNDSPFVVLSRHMGKPTICLGENKGADQLRSNCEADQRLCFRYTDSTVPLLLKDVVWDIFVFALGNTPGFHLIRAKVCSVFKLKFALNIPYYVYLFLETRHTISRCHIATHFDLKACPKVQVGKDQEKAQSEKDSHSKNRGGKKPN